MIGTPDFCPPNVSISDIWINHGISQCFIDTLCSSVLAGFILLFGTAQLIIFKKYSIPIDANRIRTSWIYKMQMSLMLLLPFLETLQLLLRWELYEKLPVYGFMVSVLQQTQKSFFILYFICQDLLYFVDHSCEPLRHLSDQQRTSSSATVSRFSVTWKNITDFFCDDFHSPKHHFDQYQFDRLVV